jgi:hypothetical protein
VTQGSPWIRFRALGDPLARFDGSRLAKIAPGTRADGLRDLHAQKSSTSSIYEMERWNDVSDTDDDAMKYELTRCARPVTGVDQNRLDIGLTLDS